MPSFEVRKVEGLIEYALCVYVRVAVFVNEQKIPIEDEVDVHEDAAVHYIGCVDRVPVTTCRYRMVDEGRIAKIERVATVVHYRRRGHARTMLERVIEDITMVGWCKLIRVSAQDHAISFYEMLGFAVDGAGYLEDGIAHHAMTRALRG